MNTQHALTRAAQPRDDREAARPDALARYRLPPGAIAPAQARATGGVVVVFADAAQRLWGPMAAVAAVLRRWRERAHSRKSLSGLDPRMLRDIGISPSQLWHETNKPFWRD
jgi:uncharacterized protein YjiS (DUF1127 family)